MAGIQSLTGLNTKVNRSTDMFHWAAFYGVDNFCMCDL